MMKATYSKVVHITALTVLFVLLISVAAFSDTATVAVTKDGAQIPGGSWYDYYPSGGYSASVYTNDFCCFYADVVPAITAPGYATTVNSAKLRLYFDGIAGSSPYVVKTFTGNTPWTEASGPFPGWDTNYPDTTIGGSGYVDIDVTAMVQDWVNGVTNNGAGLYFGASNSATCISREAVSGWETAQPKFIIDYTKTAAPGTYTATVAVTKDGAQIPGGSWYDYWPSGGYSAFVYTNNFCYFYADLVPVITAPGFSTAVTSAKLKLYFSEVGGVSPYVVHTFTGNTPWTEASGPDPGRDTTYPNTTIAGSGRVEIDVTAMVQDWVDGATNNGAGIFFGASNSAVCISREAVSGWESAQPKFEINYVQTAFVPHGIVQGNITLSDFSGDLSLCPISVQLIPTSGGSGQQQAITPTSNPMPYKFSDVVPGTYNVSFKTNNWLRTVNTGVVVSGTGAAVESSAILINGDLNGDNTVTNTDVSATLNNLDQKGD